MENANWTILGPGAIGSLWTGCLQASGQTVRLLSRRRIQGQLQIEGEQAIHCDFNTITSDNIDSPIERLLVTTKAQHTLNALEQLRPHLNRNSQLFILQNGMAAMDVAKQFPEQQVFAGVTTDGAYWRAPLQLVHAGRGQTLLGALGSNISQKDTEQLAATLPTSYLTIKSVDDIVQRLWKKLAINCAINALTVQHQCRNGELLAIPTAMQTVNDICNELRIVAEQLAVKSDFSRLENEVVAVLEATATNYSSMYQDIQQGRTTEIDFINGYLCRQAERHNIGCPVNQRLVEQIKKIEKEI